MGKLLIAIGLVVAGLGVLMTLGVPLGRLADLPALFVDCDVH